MQEPSNHLDRQRVPPGHGWSENGRVPWPESNGVVRSADHTLHCIACRGSARVHLDREDHLSVVGVACRLYTGSSLTRLSALSDGDGHVDGQVLIPRGVYLGHIGLRVAESHLGGFQPKALANLGRVAVPQLVRVPGEGP